MTSQPHHDHHDAPPSLPRTSAGVLAASIAEAAIVGVLTLIQNAPPGTQSPVPASADSTPQRDATLPLDAGVQRHRANHAPAPDGATPADRER